MLGRVLSFRPLENNNEVDVSYLKSGTYIISGERNGQVIFSQKIVKN
jgi:hypothetical protein